MTSLRFHCYVKEDFLQFVLYHFMYSGFLCVRISGGAFVHQLRRDLRQVRRPLGVWIRGWLTLTRPICHPKRGGEGCVCLCDRVSMNECACSRTHSMEPHNVTAFILHMTLEGAGVDMCPIVSGNLSRHEGTLN